MHLCAALVWARRTSQEAAEIAEGLVMREAAGVNRMASTAGLRVLLVIGRSYKISVSCRKDLEISTDQLARNAFIWYKYGTRKYELAREKCTWRSRVSQGINCHYASWNYRHTRPTRRSACYTIGKPQECAHIQGQQSSPRSVREYHAESKLTLGCHNMLNTLPEERIVELLWTPGNSEIRGNEKTHELAILRPEQQIVGSEDLSSEWAIRLLQVSR